MKHRATRAHVSESGARTLHFIQRHKGLFVLSSPKLDQRSLWLWERPEEILCSDGGRLKPALFTSYHMAIWHRQRINNLKNEVINYTQAPLSQSLSSLDKFPGEEESGDLLHFSSEGRAPKQGAFRLWQDKKKMLFSGRGRAINTHELTTALIAIPWASSQYSKIDDIYEVPLLGEELLTVCGYWRKSVFFKDVVSDMLPMFHSVGHTRVHVGINNCKRKGGGGGGGYESERKAWEGLGKREVSRVYIIKICYIHIWNCQWIKM